MRRFFALSVCFALIPATAHAEWLEARTDHFVLTINDTQENARRFAERLERFDGAIRRLYGVADDPDQHLRPLAIYALSDRLFQDTCACSLAVGYYESHIKQSVIFTLHMPVADRKAPIGGWSSQMVLLHEYSHHFAFNNFPIAYPKWFSEGFAEFNATAGFEPDGSVVIGYPANYRAEAIFNGGLSLYQLFEPERAGLSVYNIDAFYGRGWLLTHYLMLSRPRAGQLSRYLDLVNRGNSGMQAAKLAFGDLKALNKELSAYSHQLAPQLRISPGRKAITVTMRQLSPGEAAMIPVYARMRSGIPGGQGAGLAQKAAGIARRYPNDPAVQSEWAEIEYAAGRLAKALEAADTALRLNPQSVDALVVKGTVTSDVLFKAKSRDHNDWQGARDWLLKANRADPNAVMPLFQYYSTFLREGVSPSAGAVKGLMRAAVLAPESSSVRALVAREMLLTGDAASARALLQPLAFAPHTQRDDNLPLQLIQLIDARRIEDAKQLVMSKTDEDPKKSR